MRIFLIGCYLSFSLLCNAQGTFQKIYNCYTPEESAEYLTKCSDGGFIFSTIGYLYGIKIFKTDSFGTVEWINFISYASQGFNIIETHDHNFILSGFRNENSGYRLAPFLVKISSNGNIIWSRGYNITCLLDPVSSTSAVVQSIDSGYVLMSSLPNCGFGNSHVVIIKTDSLGNGVWMKSYSGTNSVWGNSIIKAKPSGYIIYGSLNSFGPIAKVIFKINESGMLQWARSVGETSIYPGGEPIQQANDFGYLFLGDGVNGKIICKADSSGEFLWAKSFTSNYPLHVASLIQTNDGGIAFSGSLIDGGRNHAFIVKLDSVGNTTWTKFYDDSLSNSSGASTLLQTADSGFAFSGWHYGSSWDYLLLVKTDSLGNLLCPSSSIPGFQSTIENFPDSLVLINAQSIALSDSSLTFNNSYLYSEEPFCFSPVNTTINELINSTVAIYPNPFNSSATLVIKNEELKIVNCNLRVYNSMGALVRLEHIPDITSYILHRAGLSEGLYFFELRYNNSELVGNGKFVIE